MSPDNYKARMRDELRQLNDKHHKLSEFIKGEVFPSLIQEKRDLLIMQLEAMTQYSTILGKRLELENG